MSRLDFDNNLQEHQHRLFRLPTRRLGHPRVHMFPK